MRSMWDRKLRSTSENTTAQLPTEEPQSNPETVYPDSITTAEASPPAAPGSQYNNIQWTLIALAVYSSAFFYGLDTTIVAVVQGPIVERFGEVEKLGWLGIGFPLGSIATIAVWSKSYGMFDTKWMYIGSLVHFAAGSALCGAAPTMNGLIVGRVWAGAGGAGMYLGQLNIWTQNTIIEKRSLYISGGGMVWGAGCILGPIIGGAFADSSATWRWAFYMNLVLFGIFSPVYFIVIRSFMPRPNDSLVTRLKELDWLGVILNSGMYVSFVIGFAIGGTLWPWSDGRTIGSIVACGLVFILFCIQQKYSFLTTPTDQIFPLRFLKSKTFWLLFIGQSCTSTVLAVAIFYIPLIFQFTRAESAVSSAVRLLPLVIINIVTVFANGYLLPKLKYYMPWYVASGVMNTIGGALFFGTLDRSTSNAAIYGYSVLLALGTGFTQQAAYSVAAVKAPNHVSDAIGFINTAQIGSVVVALTFTSLIFQNVGFHKVKDALSGLGFGDHEIRAALGGARSRIFESDSISAAVRMQVQEGIIDAIRWSFITVLIAGVASLIAGVLMKREKLFGASEENKEVLKATETQEDGQEKAKE
ncbi:MFS general substrate transporter [Aaosphaeria arxii CBS 175.79]|uniref:MFS general substrate transporter n=1 Tax=Aaosphaeria arxii CBS 175.79 TaxID=1450172 RepID=A0A6A5XEV6_9PLEO|nr:MFS general substrate transporter [Aaosphaeria arxii CBS 175.79]KAF2011453.1 MFS general substrate transporter [Aaosphaeria arxii CBS 175.79]